MADFEGDAHVEPPAALEVAAYLNTPDRSLHRREVAAARERLGEQPWKHATNLARRR